MNGVHDLGGMHGFGPVEPELDEPLFHAEWEGRVLAAMLLTREGNWYNLDAFRFGIEQMAPAHYLRSSYYERWLATVEYNLVQAGVLAPGEVDARVASPRQAQALAVSPATDRPKPVVEELESHPLPPRFAVGDVVVTRNVHVTGHTRLPRYARGKRGVIHLVHGVYVLPDTNAHGLGEHPEPVYNVHFAASELWGESAEPRQVVAIDLWQSYLEPAPA